MKTIGAIIQSDLNRTFWVIGIIASLCFSAGEGLRLTPFPADDVIQMQLLHGQLSTSSSCETTPTKYGPIDLPKQAQALSQHKCIDTDYLPPNAADNLLYRYYDFPDPAEPVGVATLRLPSRARDRAPPSLTS